MPWKDSTKPGLLVYDVTCDDDFVEDEEYYYVVCTIMFFVYNGISIFSKFKKI